MPLTSRLMMVAFSLLPFWLLIEGLVRGWISLPMGMPRTRRLHPRAYWTTEFIFAVLGILMILTAVLA